jgi:endonuclease III
MVAEKAFHSETVEVKGNIPALASQAAPAPGTGLVSLDVVGEKTAQLLEEHGFPTVESVAQSSLDALCEVPGIGPKRAQLLIDSATAFLKGAPGSAESVAPGE